MPEFELCVKTRTLQILLFQVDENWTIIQLKQEIETRTNTSTDKFDLFRDTVQLTDEDATLGSLGILPDGCPGGPILTMSRTPYDPYDIVLQKPNGGLHTMYVSKVMSVGQLRAAVCDDLGLPYLMTKLYKNGEELKERKKLEDYDVGPVGEPVEVRTRGPRAVQSQPVVVA